MGDVFAKWERNFIIHFVYACVNDLYSRVLVLTFGLRSRPMDIIKVTKCRRVGTDVFEFKLRTDTSYVRFPGDVPSHTHVAYH